MGDLPAGQPGVFHIVQKGLTEEVDDRLLDQSKVFEELVRNGVAFFTGVPDSYLNGFCNYALARCPERNVIAANEGNAVAIAAWHYFVSREIPPVYMHRSADGPDSF